MSTTTSAERAALLARQFHEAYERLAPTFGYETRAETRKFDPLSPNGRLMVAVCAELLAAPSPASTEADELATLRLAHQEDREYIGRLEHTIEQLKSAPSPAEVPAEPVAWLEEEDENGVLKTIADGFAQFGYRQGTKECIAFHRGIRYALDRAALSSTAAEAAGWRLVPVEPTSEMVSAGGQWGVFAGSVWRAMIASAPQPAGNTEGTTYSELTAALRDLLDMWHGGHLHVRPEASGAWCSVVQAGEDAILKATEGTP